MHRNYHHFARILSVGKHLLGKVLVDHGGFQGQFLRVIDLICFCRGLRRLVCGLRHGEVIEAGHLPLVQEDDAIHLIK